MALSQRRPTVLGISSPGSSVKNLRRLRLLEAVQRVDPDHLDPHDVQRRLVAADRRDLLATPVRDRGDDAGIGGILLGIDGVERGFGIAVVAVEMRHEALDLPCVSQNRLVSITMPGRASRSSASSCACAGTANSIAANAMLCGATSLKASAVPCAPRAQRPVVDLFNRE